MTRVLLEQDIRGHSGRGSRGRRESRSRQPRPKGRTAGRQTRETTQMRLYRSAEDRRERREALKTYLLGLAVIALVTAAVVVVPLLRAEGLASGDEPGVDSMQGNRAFESAEAPTGRPDVSAEQSAGSGGAPADPQRPAVELAAVSIEATLPIVTFERTEPEEYLVSDGETLSSIAALYDLDWKDLARFNGLGNPDRLRSGQRIMIPPESDTLLQSDKQ
jgi:nucleoid-associated protein YgaU